MKSININKSDSIELQKIIHIGVKRAAKIIESRPFKDVYELSKILGLGTKRMNDILNQNNLKLTI